MTTRAFALNDGEVSAALRTGRGFVFETVTASRIPTSPSSMR